MKHLTTSFLLSAFAVCVHAQTVADYQPDANGDGCIGSADIISLLTLYGTGDCPQFACGQPLSYQGYDYATVQIGEQCWFAENLRNENYANGDSIPVGLEDSMWGGEIGQSSVYGELPDFVGCVGLFPFGEECDEAWSLSEYGRLYNWYAVDDARGLCPSGWHVPTDEEWMTMEMALGMSESDANSTGMRGPNQGPQMKTDYGWWNEGNGTNSSGFSGLPGGYRTFGGEFLDGGQLGYWYSSSPNGSSASYRALSHSHEYVIRGGNPPPNAAFSVRCIQDAE